ncbi:hypothetical protein K488DRAFT_81693 [Vararia minispora EC-137]|uniref:Uncharacterized protein n=1 Tax=Vararia minispora EC-137 TaxID=1314806 RepID=A0ACB8QZD7_9AGAM|nr:hypothetical protein K488DRAFT_81693 [Vararia minispora EC-137]
MPAMFTSTRSGHNWRTYYALVWDPRGYFRQRREGEITCVMRKTADGRVEIGEGSPKEPPALRGRQTRTSWCVRAFSNDGAIGDEPSDGPQAPAPPPIVGDALYRDWASAVSDRSKRVEGAPQNVKFMCLHAGSIRFIRYRKTGPHKQLQFEIRAPIPRYWVDFCNKLAIPLEDDMLEGGVWIDGERCLDKNVPDLEGKWVW